MDDDSFGFLLMLGLISLGRLIYVTHCAVKRWEQLPTEVPVDHIVIAGQSVAIFDDFEIIWRLVRYAYESREKHEMLRVKLHRMFLSVLQLFHPNSRWVLHQLWACTHCAAVLLSRRILREQMRVSAYQKLSNG
jgi:hypothetical protein